MAQTLISAAFVLACVAYLVTRLVRSARRGAGGCGAGCKCGSAGEPNDDRLGVRRELVQVNLDARREQP